MPAPALLGCGGGGCPTSSKAPVREQWERELRRRTVMALQPQANITIKRDVHNVLIGADAATLATALRDVLQDPKRRFGLIRIDRLSENVGKPFTVGEKFQGRYELAEAARREAPRAWRRFFGELAEEKWVRNWLCRIENGHTSDYGVISDLVDAPAEGKPYTFTYEYLTGSPIRGSSTFEIHAVTDPAILSHHGVPAAARLTQIFVYQELTDSFANFFTSGGLKLHNQVVYSQAEQAAEVAGARILDSDIPPEYQTF